MTKTNYPPPHLHVNPTAMPMGPGRSSLTGSAHSVPPTIGPSPRLDRLRLGRPGLAAATRQPRPVPTCRGPPTAEAGQGRSGALAPSRSFLILYSHQPAGPPSERGAPAHFNSQPGGRSCHGVQERAKRIQVQLHLPLRQKGHLLRLSPLPPEDATAAGVLFPRRGRKDIRSLFRRICSGLEPVEVSRVGAFGR